MAALAIALLYISEPVPAAISKASSSLNTATQSKDVSLSFGAQGNPIDEPDIDEARTKELRDQVYQELLQTSRHTGPPHQVSQHGEYSGWVWTIPESRYDKTEALLNWPPATEGPKAAATKWFGSLKAGSIFLASQHTLEDSDKVPVMQIPLAGCTVRLVTEGLRGKTRWWRKTPLEISHPSRDLLARQKNFLLFCDGSAAKEQWLTALSWACSAGGPPRAVQELYSAFCSALRENKRLHFPQQAHTPEPHAESDTSKEGGQTEAGAQPKKKGLFKRGWGSKNKSADEKQVKANKSNLGHSTAALEHKSAAFINPEDLDKLWMEAPQSKAKPAKSAARQEEQQPQQQQQHQQPASLEKQTSQEGFVDHAGDSLDDAAAAGMKGRAGVVRSKSSASVGALQGSPLHPSHSHHTGGVDDADMLRHSSARSDSEASMGSPLTHHGNPRDASGAFYGADTGGAHTIAIEHAVNMLLARVAFDLLRSPKFKLQIIAHIQKKLDELKVPDYINALQVVDVELGSGVPHISNLQALASPSSVIWPQALFDLDFTGDIKLILAAKVDVRDGLAWSSLDKYIKNIEGGGPGAAGLQAHPSDDAAAAVAAAGVADSEEVAHADALGSSPVLSSTPTGADDPTKKLGRVSQFLGKLQLRKRVAGGIRQLAEQTAQSISKMELKLSMDIKALRGPLYVWLPPPPGDRMWFSFLEAPQLQVTASPLVAGRMVKYSYYIARISSFIASKMQSSVTKNLVFPSCGDIKILQLLSLEDEAVTASIPSLSTSRTSPAVAATTAAALASEDAGKPDAGHKAKTDVKRYGRTTSAGGTTTVATPPPPSAATALNQATARGQGPTPPASASALSASLLGISQHVSADSAQSDGQTAGLSHQATKEVTKASTTMKTAGADPNDPALHGLSEEESGHSFSRGVSPKAPSFSRGVSFSSTHGSGPIGSPASSSQDRNQSDSFTRLVASARDSGHHEHEGVELGMMRGSSQNIGDDLLAEELHSFAPDSAEAQAGSSAIRHGQAQSMQASQVLGPPGADGRQSQQMSVSGQQTQPVSFQSLAALASRHASQVNPSHAPVALSGEAVTVGAPGVGEASKRPPTQAQLPFRSAAEGGFDSAAQHQERLAAVSTGRPLTSDTPGVTPARGGPTSAQPNATSARTAALGRVGSEKKWAYPMPTGSPMFERVRSRNHDQEPGSEAEQPQPVLLPAHAAAPQQPAQLPQASDTDRLDEPGQQPAAGVPGSAAYPAPPGPSAPASATAHTEVSSPGRGDSAAVKESLAGPSSPTPPRSSLTGEGSGGYTASPKSWFGQQIKGNTGLAGRAWEAKKDDIQQKSKKFASNVMGSFTRAEEKWRQSLQSKEQQSTK
ncbi:TPA: hypothetical protein ACH3X1_002948 [Trebouxia sp. C0004]